MPSKSEIHIISVDSDIFSYLMKTELLLKGSKNKKLKLKIML
ncbi:MAG: hypothetical protein CM15mP102_08970 [Flavobacteriales bacterium]|nr:MAG: hypothetical protein CM15mP102_08970 [Flavobacteriales bacterium]